MVYIRFPSPSILRTDSTVPFNVKHLFCCFLNDECTIGCISHIFRNYNNDISVNLVHSVLIEVSAKAEIIVRLGRVDSCILTA